jgi:hypothetical protein
MNSEASRELSAVAALRGDGEEAQKSADRLTSRNADGLGV